MENRLIRLSLTNRDSGAYAQGDDRAGSGAA